MSAPLTPEHIEAATAMGWLLSPNKPDDKDEMVAAYADLFRSDEAKRRLAEYDFDEVSDPAAEKARELILPGLLAAEARHIEIPKQWPYVFHRSADGREIETWDEIDDGSLPQSRPRGAPISCDSQHGEKVFQYSIENHEIAVAIKIKRENISSGSYLAEFPSIALSLVERFIQKEEIIHANVFNSGLVYNPAIGGDGVPLFDERHPYRDGYYSNKAGFDLSEAAVEDLAVRIRDFRDVAGLRLLARVRKLIVPIHLEFAAERLFRDGWMPFVSEGYQVLDYLENPKAWFLLTTVTGLVSITRQPFRLTTKIEDGGLVIEATQSYAVGHHNPRACFGSFSA